VKQRIASETTNSNKLAQLKHEKIEIIEQQVSPPMLLK
jgi:hypothetical protein